MRLSEIDLLHDLPPGTAALAFEQYREELEPGLHHALDGEIVDLTHQGWWRLAMTAWGAWKGPLSFRIKEVFEYQPDAAFEWTGKANALLDLSSIDILHGFPDGTAALSFELDRDQLKEGVCYLSAGGLTGLTHQGWWRLAMSWEDALSVRIREVLERRYLSDRKREAEATGQEPFSFFDMFR